MLLGYARVSTSEQNLDMQLEALSKAGCDRVFTDTMSGVKQERPGLTALLNHVRAGDEILVWKLDRLGRSTRHLLELVESFDAQDVTLRSVTEGISTEGAMGRLVLTIMAAVATLERETIVERTRAGLESARLKGKVGGRPPALTRKQLDRARKLKAGGLAVPEVAKVFGIGTSTMYRLLAKEVAA